MLLSNAHGTSLDSAASRSRHAMFSWKTFCTSKIYVTSALEVSAGFAAFKKVNKFSVKGRKKLQEKGKGSQK